MSEKLPETKRDLAYWAFEKLIENKGIPQANTGLWTPK